MSAADCRANRCSCAAKADAQVGGRTVGQRTQIGHRGPDGLIVWELSPMIAWVVPVWAAHVEALRSAPAVSLGWVDGWLVYRTHPYEPKLADYAVGRIRWDHNAETEPALFELPA